MKIVNTVLKPLLNAERDAGRKEERAAWTEWKDRQQKEGGTRFNEKIPPPNGQGG